MTTEVLNTLIAARELISDQKRWTQGSYAKTDDGVGTAPCSILAKCWCSLGAIRKSSADMANQNCAEIRLFCAMADEVAEFNDTHEHHEVLAAFDKAIENLRKEQAQ